MSETAAHDRVRELEAENARLRRLLDQQGMPGVLRHQVRNVLGTLRAIMRRSAETSTSVVDYAAHLEGRFDALLRGQALVLSGAAEGVDLHTLVANELLAHAVHEGERVEIAGPDVRLPAKTAEILGLALHELMTNAIKFGAMTQPSGGLAVTWRFEPDEPSILALTWTETGMSGLDPEPAFRGFGLEVLEGMTRYQFKAETSLDFRPDGLRCTIRVPVPGRAES